MPTRSSFVGIKLNCSRVTQKMSREIIDQLIAACLAGDLLRLQFRVATGADMKDIAGYLMICAVEGGNIQVVRFIQDMTGIKYFQRDAALLIAVNLKRWDIVRYLVALKPSSRVLNQIMKDNDVLRAIGM